MSPGTPPDASPAPATADLARLRLDRDRPRRVRRGPRGLTLVLGAAAALGLVALLAGDVLPFRRPAVNVVQTRAMESGGGATAGAPVLSASGYVVARVRAAVAPEITGRLVELRVDVGSKVRRGELLGRLADEDLIARAREAEATIASSDAALAEAVTVAEDLRREAGRQRDLLAQELTSQAKHDAALAAAEAAEARVKTADGRLGTARAALSVAQAQLEKMRIRAPFDGTVLEKNAELGEVVGPSFAASTSGGSPVVTLADLASVEVEVDVNEAYIQRVTPGMPARIQLDAYPDREYAGSVRQIVPTADRQKATVQVKVKFDAADERVLPEMGARVSFLAAADPGGAAERSVQVWIPSDGVRRIEGKTVAYVVRDDRIVVEAVQVGPPAGGEVQVLSGLGPGERVVVGDTAAKPGQRVRVREEEGA